MNTNYYSLAFEGDFFTIAADIRHSGPDLLFFIHGLGGSKDAFHHIWERDDFAEYSVLAVDLVGFGESDKPGGFSYKMEAQAQVAAELLAEFPDRKLHVIGHSMGGAVALLFPAEILNSIETFANVEGNLIGADCQLGSRGMVSVPPDVFADEMWPELRAKYSGLAPGYSALDSTTADVMYRSAESLVSWSDSDKLLDAFGALACRKAYFYGSENAAHPTVARVGSIPKVEIKRSGHILMCDNPEDFYDELHKFVTP
ncbi:MAG: alpha/beta fold hydrolase [Phycisphaerae bacterium]|jgi:pimeloyl-ACP methyl ester carboxylesterase|nr:alpha/beta fold hydrolase [Phycisphaerae bacterium]